MTKRFLQEQTTSVGVALGEVCGIPDHPDVASLHKHLLLIIFEPILMLATDKNSPELIKARAVGPQLSCHV
jgi:hypothetical protein